MANATAARRHCTGCDRIHDPGPRNPPLVRANELVISGGTPLKKVTRWFQVLRGQAQQPVSFSALCSSMLDLPRDIVVPRSPKDPAMIVCERAQYAIKNGILDRVI